MLIIFIFSALSFLLGLILSFTSYKFQFKKDSITEVINQLLPQSQCGQCGYPGCYPYANAIIKYSEKIDKCTPGGSELVLEIAELLNIKVSKKNLITKKQINNHNTVWIDEKNCVGCSKCVLFCPVDAIVGAPNFVHTVLQKFCTGCNICLLHCPTDCIKIK